VVNGSKPTAAQIGRLAGLRERFKLSDGDVRQACTQLGFQAGAMTSAQADRLIDALEKEAEVASCNS
jgi:hypothetical protein